MLFYAVTMIAYYIHPSTTKLIMVHIDCFAIFSYKHYIAPRIDTVLNDLYYIVIGLHVN